MYLLDTNICIGLLNNKDSVFLKNLQKLLPDEVFLCSIVKAELIFGAKKSLHREKNEKKLKIFFHEFECLPFDDQAAECYGEIRSYLEMAGDPVGSNDLLIAAIAIRHDFTLITRNVREFFKISSLKMIEW
ncbi:MAG: type II toxin-antitoxin system VapC family toxin [Pseudomonadota bacterium]